MIDGGREREHRRATREEGENFYGKVLLFIMLGWG
jgi:hypothetical protein